MKIGLVLPYSIAKAGGVQQQVFDLATALRSRGNIVKIITPRPDGFTKDPAENVIFLGSSRDISPKNLGTTGQISTASRRRTRQILVQEKFDVLHLHQPDVPLLGALILQANQRTDNPARTVGTFHAALPDSTGARKFARADRFYARKILPYLDSVVAVSPAAADGLKNLTTKKIEIIPNGLNLAEFQPAEPTRRAENSILYLGRLEPRKGVLYLLKAYQKLVQVLPGASLTIAGDGAQRVELENFASENHLPNVEFLGKVSDEKRLELLQSCALFCAPALYGESFGIVLIEAMAAGAVVLAGDNPGYRGVLAKFPEALIDPTDTAEFTGRLKNFLTDQTLRRNFLNFAKTEIEKYDIAAIAAAYEKIYKESAL
ncbi:MAG: glycosyltransferase family 4 protein [Candidatus Nomurabacteria bacterium]|nr:glycosyltransferase family 4 protein [Candidatus Nomurabacteria bacterium]